MNPDPDALKTPADMLTAAEVRRMIRQRFPHPVFGGVDPGEFFVSRDNSKPPQMWLWRGDAGEDSAEPWASLKTAATPASAVSPPSTRNKTTPRAICARLRGKPDSESNHQPTNRQP